MTNGVIIIGAGGHAKVCIELLQAMGEHIVCCVGGPDSPDQCISIPVLKGDEHLLDLRAAGHSRIFVAIGSNSLRQRLADTLLDQGFQLANAISPQAIVSPTARLGRGIAIMAGAIVNADAIIADLTIINTGATVDHDCRIGKAVHIAPRCSLAGNVTVGDLSFLGVGCNVIPEIQIGDRATLGAGAVVVSNIESDVTAVGIPARPIKNQRRD